MKHMYDSLDYLWSLIKKTWIWLMNNPLLPRHAGPIMTTSGWCFSSRSQIEAPWGRIRLWSLGQDMGGIFDERGWLLVCLSCTCNGTDT